jgi:hypothetical protein
MAAASDDDVHQTLFICREAKVYRIPPRPGATGYRSGDWRVADNIFTGRLRMLDTSRECQIRLEDTSRSEPVKYATAMTRSLPARP